MSEYWAKKQLVEAHQALDVAGVPDRETRPDARSSSGDNVFTLSVPERIRILDRRLGNLKAMFRANMLRAIWPEDVNVNAEIDRVLAEIDK